MYSESSCFAILLAPVATLKTTAVVVDSKLHGAIEQYERLPMGCALGHLFVAAAATKVHSEAFAQREEPAGQIQKLPLVLFATRIALKLTTRGTTITSRRLDEWNVILKKRFSMAAIRAPSPAPSSVPSQSSAPAFAPPPTSDASAMSALTTQTQIKQHVALVSANMSDLVRHINDSS